MPLVIPAAVYFISLPANTVPSFTPHFTDTGRLRLLPPVEQVSVPTMR
jgi:hypothetical protein